MSPTALAAFFSIAAISGSGGRPGGGYSRDYMISDAAMNHETNAKTDSNTKIT